MNQFVTFEELAYEYTKTIEHVSFLQTGPSKSINYETQVYVGGGARSVLNPF